MGILDAPSVPLTKAGQESLAMQRAIALQSWYAALGNRWYVRPNVVVVGDSITEGQGATAFANRYIARLAANLRTLFPVGSIPGGRGHIAISKSGETSYTWPVTSTLNATHTASVGAKRWNSLMSATGHTASAALHGTSCDLMYQQANGNGTFGYAVDGGSVTNKSTSAAPTTDGKLLRVTLGASGDHTLVLTWVSGSNNVHGLVEYDGDETQGPPMVHDCGHYGYLTSNWAAAPFDPVANWPASIAALSPHVIVIEIGTNDIAVGPVSAATMKTNIQTLITNLRAVPALASIPIVLLPVWARDTYALTWPAYVAAQYEIAAADPLTVVCDLSKRMPAKSADTLSLYADGVHPTDKGHAMMADALTRFLSPV